jgi:uncharacterized protein (DUF4415 family)
MTAKSPAMKNTSAHKPPIKSDLARVDASVVTQADYEELPEWSEEMLARGEIRDGDTLVRVAIGTFTRARGRPKIDHPKQQQTLRLSADVLDHFRKGGRGWQGRIDAALKEWIKQKA